MERKDEVQKTHQAILILKNADPMEIASEMVTAGMTVLHQYNSKSNSFVGSYEASEFTKHWDSWVKDNGLKQRVFFADSAEQLEEISYLAELESVPQSAFDEESSVLVLGPFTEARLNFLTEKLEEKK